MIWLLAVEGRQGIGRDEAQYMRAGERYWGWFSELGDNLAHGRPGRSFTPSDIDRYWSDNAPDHPVVMKALYGLSWRAFHTCTCMGATHGFHPVPDPRAAHDAAAVLARLDRVSLPGHPVRGAAGRPRLPVRARLAVARRRRRWRRC